MMLSSHKVQQVTSGLTGPSETPCQTMKILKEKKSWSFSRRRPWKRRRRRWRPHQRRQQQEPVHIRQQCDSNNPLRLETNSECTRTRLDWCQKPCAGDDTALQLSHSSFKSSSERGSTRSSGGSGSTKLTSALLLLVILITQQPLIKAFSPAGKEFKEIRTFFL